MSKKRLSSVRPPPAVRPPPTDGRPNNRLLSALPAEDFNRLEPFLTTVPIRVKQVLHKIGEPLQHVYFPNAGVCSVTALLSNGTMIEAAAVGDEGMLGIEAFFTDHPFASGETLMQVPEANADAECLGVEDFRRELAQRGALHKLMGRYAQAKLGEIIQSVACNAIHPVQQRCARWLLMMHDRMHEHDFHLSHEFLAVMLGVQRPTVSVVAGTLQHAGLISYVHGRVSVRDRKGLEAASCECYPIIRAHFERLRQ